jgi:hypothetical protein
MRDPGINGKKILTLILKKEDGGCRLDLFYSGYGPLVGSCEHGNEHFVFTKFCYGLEQLSDY